MPPRKAQEALRTPNAPRPLSQFYIIILLSLGLKPAQIRGTASVFQFFVRKKNAAKMTRTSTELPRLEPESSASTNSAMAA